MRRLITLVLSLAVIGVIAEPQWSNAANVTTTLPVSASISAACAVSASGVNFGELSSGVAKQSSGTISVTCQTGVSYTVAMNGGSNLQGTPLLRTMKHASLNEFVGYQLFKDSALTQEWGDAGAGNLFQAGTPVSGTGTGSAQQLTVYGLQNGFLNTASPGSYSDTVLVTVLF